MACHQRQYSTLSILIIQIRIKTNKQTKKTINCLIVMAMVGLISSLPEPVRPQAPPAKPFLRHLTAIFTALWPEKEIFLLHQRIFSHVCISVVLMPIVFIVAVLLDGDKDNKFSKQDSMNEIYLHCKRHDLLTAEGCCHRKDAVRYLTASGLQPVHNIYWNVLWITEIICLILLTHSIKYIW